MLTVWSWRSLLQPWLPIIDITKKLKCEFNYHISHIHYLWSEHLGQFQLAENFRWAGDFNNEENRWHRGWGWSWKKQFFQLSKRVWDPEIEDTSDTIFREKHKANNWLLHLSPLGSTQSPNIFFPHNGWFSTRATGHMKLGLNWHRLRTAWVIDCWTR